MKLTNENIKEIVILSSAQLSASLTEVSKIQINLFPIFELSKNKNYRCYL